MTVAPEDFAAMEKTLDKMYGEIDKEWRDLRPGDGEWEWARQHLKAFTDRISEIEWSLSMHVGREAFVAELIKWQKNVRHVMKKIREHRTNPF